ncbi:MAG TPA: fumarate reductase subunit FrdD [Usitatibacter sp.]|nr:fumarate reductase subunit FrdD [Usitatibacter sp.]
MSRSNQPPLWALFGAGGMLSALLGAALVFFTGIAAPLGWVGPPGGITYGQVLRFAQGPLGKVFILAVISLFLWHAAHRIYHTLHDFGIRTGPIAWVCCYGVALAATIVAALCLLAVGF